MVEGDGGDADTYCRVRQHPGTAFSAVGSTLNGGTLPPAEETEDEAERDQHNSNVREEQQCENKEEEEEAQEDYDGSLPKELPSIVDIRRALPSHVFQPSALTSLLYAGKDVAQVVATFLLAEWAWGSSLLPRWVLLLLLPVYWLLQGTFFTALFVVGHDAGHSSFSSHHWLNDTVGTVLHTFLLCPYYCWKLSHRQHHKNTGNIDRDEVFYPIRQNKPPQESKPLTTCPPCWGFGMGWFAYLVMGYGLRPVQHFNPWHPLLRRHLLACLLSVGLVGAWGLVLWHVAATSQAGFLRLFVHFLVPDFIFASYTVVITFLHHTETGVPWYGDRTWANVRGQLSSVDRHYGWCHFIIHSISTHQIHHLFPKVPHYHLEEATAVFRERFPGLVRTRSEPILPAFARMFHTFIAQRKVPHDAQVHVYS